MSNLAAKDAYLQTLGKKVCAQQNEQPRKRLFGSVRDGSEYLSKPQKKKKKRRRDGPREREQLTRDSKNVPTRQIRNENTEQKPGFPAYKPETSSFSAVDILRNRLHEKIQEAKGLGCTGTGSSEEMEKKRLRRKQERERKKRKRKEIRRQKKVEAESCQNENAASVSQGDTPASSKEQDEIFLFNKVEVPHDELSKPFMKKEKKKVIKGNITPMTGKNYKQLLNRLESRKNKIEELKEKDCKKAQELEKKITWTNVLYKAEGLKIKDNEEMLKAALKRKEKLRAQHKKKWEKRTENVLEKMQQRQDKRRRNIAKKKKMKMEKKKRRKKDRIFPEDLDKA
ncbi:surfeit locus protein 6 isoform X2 [Protopterus annectens]|nr:surfeit locus protein 6 isoform X2 [Protopterus annectens]